MAIERRSASTGCAAHRDRRGSVMLARRCTAPVVLLVLGAAACQENVTAPGACPDFCPAARLEVQDTVMQGVLGGDEWFRGYLQAYEASAMQLAAAGQGEQSRGVIELQPFSSELAEQGGLAPVVAVDSFHLEVQLVRRATTSEELELQVHRLPVTVDSATTFADLEPYFADSTLIATIPVPDTVESGTLTATLAGDAFPTLEADSLRAGVGLALRGDQSGWVDLGTREATSGQSHLTRFVKIDSSGAQADRQEARNAEFDSFVAAQGPLPTPEGLLVGGLPSARAFMRVTLPRAILDSTDIVRATLILVPESPAFGGPGDTLSLRVFGILRDFGPKSKFLPSPVDSIIRGAVAVPTGSADSIEVDITHIVRPWQSDSTLAHAITLRVVPEGSTFGEVLLASSKSGMGVPAIRLTYVPFFNQEGPP